MSVKYQSEGTVLQVTASGSPIVVDTVVKIGSLLGVALGNIAVGETGSVMIKGIFRALPKVSGAVIAAGEPLTWDVSASAFDDNAATPATGDVKGAPAVAIAAVGTGVTVIDVLFTGVPGTVA